MHSWRKFQTQTKLKSFLSKLKIALIAGVIVIVIVRLYLLGEWLLRAPGGGVAMQPVEWSGRDQINLFVNPDWVVGFDPADHKVSYFRLDQPEGKSNLSDGPASPESQRGEFVLLLKQRKVLLDSYILLESGVGELSELSSRLWMPLVRDQLQTNLTRWQVARLAWGLRSAGSPQLSADQTLPEDQVVDEALRISILNGTDVGGLALEVATWVENLGAKVVNVANADARTDRTRIEVFAPSNEQYQTVQRLEQIFKITAEYVEINEPQREDVRVTVGKDFLR